MLDTGRGATPGCRGTGGVQVGVARHLRAPEAGRHPRAAVSPPTVRLDGQPAAGLPGGAPVGHADGGRSDRACGGIGPEFGGGGVGASGADRATRGGTLDAPPRAARAGVLGVAAHAGAGPVRAVEPTLGAFGAALGTLAVLVELRTVAAACLGTLPAPVGFRTAHKKAARVARKKTVGAASAKKQHETGSDPPGHLSRVGTSGTQPPPV